MSDFQLDHLTFNDIKLMKRALFKKLVKNASKKAGLAYLLENKEEKNKIVNLQYDELKMQKYYLS